MSTDDDIAEQLVEGEPYEQARVTVRQTFGFSLQRKITATVGVLALSTLLAPAVVFRRSLAESLESTPEPFTPQFGMLALYGIAITVVAGLFLLRHRRLIRSSSLTVEKARRLVRLEDLFMWFVVFGSGCILVSLGFALVGVFSPEAVEALYENEIGVYSQAELIRLDVRIVSSLGGASAIVLWWLSSRAEARQ